MHINGSNLTVFMGCVAAVVGAAACWLARQPADSSNGAIYGAEWCES